MCGLTRKLRLWKMLKYAKNYLKLHYELPGHFRRLYNKNLTLKNYVYF